MNTIPGLGEILTKVAAHIISQCGAIEVLLIVWAISSTWQLVKTRAAWEAERAETVKLREADKDAMLKIIKDSNETYDNIAITQARIEGVILALQTRGTGDN